MKKCIGILGTGWLNTFFADTFQNYYDFKLAVSSKEKKENLSRVFENVIQVKLSENEISGNLNALLECETLIISLPPYSNVKKFNYYTLIKAIESAEVKNVLFYSSVSVYKKTNLIVNEKSERDYNNILCHYEDLFYENLSFNATVLRFGGLIGGSRHPGRFFLKKGIIENGKAKTNLIHYKDCINIIHQILQKNVWNEVFNCCAGCHPTKSEFYVSASKQLGYHIEAIQNLKPDSYVEVDNSKLVSRLNYEFIYDDPICLIKDNEWL